MDFYYGGEEEEKTTECVKTADYENDKKYYTRLIIAIVIIIIIVIFFFDPFDLWKEPILGEENEENKKIYHIKDMGMEGAGWAVLGLGSGAMGFLTARRMIFGKVALMESEATACEGKSYFGLIIAMILLLIIIVGFFDPLDLWHELTYRPGDTDCDKRLFEKHKKDMEIGGWTILVFGSLMLGASAAYLNYHGRHKIM